MLRATLSIWREELLLLLVLVDVAVVVAGPVAVAGFLGAIVEACDSSSVQVSVARSKYLVGSRGKSCCWLVVGCELVPGLLGLYSFLL